MRRALIAAVLLVSAPALAQLVTFPGVGGGAGGVVVSTTGPVNLTGTTAETNMASLKIPANSMGKNGAVEIKALWSYTNSANVKTLQPRFTSTAGATSGGVLWPNAAQTTTASFQMLLILHNNNATNSQTAFANAGGSPFASTASAIATSSIDTTADSFINLNGVLALSTETLTLQRATATVFPAP